MAELRDKFELTPGNRRVVLERKGQPPVIIGWIDASVRRPLQHAKFETLRPGVTTPVHWSNVLKSDVIVIEATLTRVTTRIVWYTEDSIVRNVSTQADPTTGA